MTRQEWLEKRDQLAKSTRDELDGMAARARTAHKLALTGPDGSWDSYGVYSDKAWDAALDEYRTATIAADTDYWSLVTELNGANAEIARLREALHNAERERDEVISACRGTQMDAAALASVREYVKEKIVIQDQRDALRQENLKLTVEVEIANRALTKSNEVVNRLLSEIDKLRGVPLLVGTRGVK